jgi:hypothetical protein
MIAALPFRCGICYLIHYHSVMTMLPPKYYLSTLEKELSFQEMLFVFGSIHPFWRYPSVLHRRRQLQEIELHDGIREKIGPRHWRLLSLEGH